MTQLIPMMEVSFDELDISMNVDIDELEATGDHLTSTGPSSITAVAKNSAGQSSTQESYLNNNCESLPGNDVQQCSSCSYQTKHKSKLYRHKKWLHDIRKYTCDECRKGIQRIVLFKRTCHVSAPQRSLPL